MNNYSVLREQSAIQVILEEVHRTRGFEACLARLESLGYDSGYLEADRLEDNSRLCFYHRSSGIDFRLQINVARSRYSSALPPLPPGALCRICPANVGAPSKENLRIYRFLLAPGRQFFFQWTPFPLFPSHGVLVQEDHSPMRMDRQVLEDGAAFLGLAPNYTFFSNSDRAQTGASILEHLHYQVALGRTLPIMEARARRSLSRGPVSISWLEYPLAAVRLVGPSADSLVDEGTKLIQAWKSSDPVHHSLNLAWRNRPAGGSELTLMFRSQLALPPPSAHRYKTEGVGVIEAGGEFVFPVPEGPEAPQIEAEIRSRGRDILLSFLEGMDPWSRDPEVEWARVVAALEA